MMFNILKNCMNFITVYNFYWKEQKLERLTCNELCSIKKKSYTHKKFKQALNHRLGLKKAHRIIRFKKEIWLKLYLDMNTELRKNGKKNDLPTKKIYIHKNSLFRRCNIGNQ